MQSKKNTFITIVIFIGVIIIFHYIGLLRPLENFLLAVGNKSSSLVYNLSNKIKDKKYLLTNKKELYKKYNELNEQYNDLKAQEVSSALLKEENKKLRDQLYFFEKNSFKHTGAEVIGRNIDPMGTTLIINKGLEFGIKNNYPVITDNGLLIGKIMRVENKMSVVRLINDAQSRIIASVINSDKSIGVVEGGYGITVHMNFIPQNEIVNTGDIVITSGLEEKIPHGLVIGTIEIIEKKTQEPFQEAVLQPAANLNKIELVSVITE